MGWMKLQQYVARSDHISMVGACNVSAPLGINNVEKSCTMGAKQRSTPEHAVQPISQIHQQIWSLGLPPHWHQPQTAQNLQLGQPAELIAGKPAFAHRLNGCLLCNSTCSGQGNRSATPKALSAGQKDSLFSSKLVCDASTTHPASAAA